MTFAEFKAFDKFQQVELTIEHGVVVARRLDSFTMYKLFYIWSFYVELWYARDQSEIFAITSCDDDKLLEPYLDRIEISGIFANLNQT